MIKFTSLTAAALLAAAAFMPASAQAQTVSGTIGVRLKVTNACVVNDQTTVQSNFGSAGEIAFTDQPGTFTTVDGELVGSLGALAVRCSPGVTPSLTIGAGANDQAGVRRMISGSAAVPYRLYTNAARNDEIGIGRSLALGTAGSSAIVVPIYARATNNSGILPAGQYVDTVQVTLSW
jgi:spore coat protein U-like protein